MAEISQVQSSIEAVNDLLALAVLQAVEAVEEQVELSVQLQVQGGSESAGGGEATPDGVGELINLIA